MGHSLDKGGDGYTKKRSNNVRSFGDCCNSA